MTWHKVFFYSVVLESGSRARPVTRTLQDICWSSTHLVQWEPDEPNAGLGLTRYITRGRHACLLIDGDRHVSLVLCNACQWRYRPHAGVQAEAGSHSASNLSLILKDGRRTDTSPPCLSPLHTTDDLIRGAILFVTAGRLSEFTFGGMRRVLRK